MSSTDAAPLLPPFDWARMFRNHAHFVLSCTRFGRYVYMVGGNREAAEYRA